MKTPDFTPQELTRRIKAQAFDVRSSATVEASQPSETGNINRSELRAKQDRIIEIATERKMPFDVSISEVQIGSPTVLQLHSTIWPDYLPSINSFLNTFDK